MDKINDKCCGRCGYDLTGQERQGLCPECGCYHDAVSGEGVAGGVMDKYQRGDWVMALLRTILLLLGAMVILGIGLLVLWKTGHTGPLIVTGVVSLLFLASAVVSGLSLWRR